MLCRSEWKREISRDNGVDLFSYFTRNRLLVNGLCCFRECICAYKIRCLCVKEAEVGRNAKQEISHWGATEVQQSGGGGRTGQDLVTSFSLLSSACS